MTEAITTQPVSCKIQPFQGSPTFAWIVANRVTNPYQDMDCIILISGRKRSGKSTTAIALAEGIAEEIAYARGEVDGTKYFDVSTNVISVARMGGLDLLTSPRATQINQVFVLDDAKINLSNRNYQSKENQLQNDIATIIGPFRHVLIYTMVFKKTIDVGTRELADYIIRISGSNPFTQQTLGKIYFYETDGEGNEYMKYLRWKDPISNTTHRLKNFVSTLPSPEANAAYKKLRLAGSIQLIEQARAQYDDIARKKTEVKLSPTDLRNIWIANNREVVQQRRAAGDSMRKIARDMNRPVSTIEKCLTREV
jgi:hypothetical protein